VILVAALLIAYAGHVLPVVAASPWGLWNDPQGNVVAPEPGLPPAPAVQDLPAPKVQEGKPDKKWELWNDPKSAAPSVPSAPALPDAAPGVSDSVPPPMYQVLAMMQVAPDTALRTNAQGPASSTAIQSSAPVTVAQASVPILADSAPVPIPPKPSPLDGVATVRQVTEASPPAVTEAVPGDGYVIGAGDVLDIAVWKDEALTKNVIVLPDGTISFPLAGDVRAAGKTVAGFRAEMEQRLSPYVTELVLSVEVKQINSMQIYVIGRVNGPGRQVLNGNVTVLQALSTAGGLNPFARKDRITVMRTEGGETRSFPFHYSEVIEGKNLAQNILLKRGDVVVVP
jgi:polysaccharide export outer membrane protein